MVDALCPASVGYLDADPFGAELDAPLDELFQDVVHMLFEVPGSNPDVPDRGIGLSRILSSSWDPKAGAPAQQMAQRIVPGLKKDGRVRDASASLVSDDQGLISGLIQIVADAGVLGIQIAWTPSGPVVTPAPVVRR